MKTKPNPFATLAANLESTHFSAESAAGPDLHTRLDSYSILQQHALSHYLQSLLFAQSDLQTAPIPSPIASPVADPEQSTPLPKGAPTHAFLASASIRVLSLIERSKSRIDRINNRLNKKPAHHESFQLDAATQFLIAELANGHRPATDLFKCARKVGISDRTLNRAKADLGVISFQRALLPPGPNAPHIKTRSWFWELPDSVYEFLNNTGADFDALRSFLRSQATPSQLSPDNVTPNSTSNSTPNSTPDSTSAESAPVQLTSTQSNSNQPDSIQPTTEQPTSHCHIAMAI